MSHHNQIVDIAMWSWHGINLVAFGLTLSPALETAEAYVRIGSGFIVAVSAAVALYFTIKKNMPTKRKFKR
jgi:hypothetical protein